MDLSICTIQHAEHYTDRVIFLTTSRCVAFIDVLAKNYHVLVLWSCNYMYIVQNLVLYIWGSIKDEYVRITDRHSVCVCVCVCVCVSKYICVRTKWLVARQILCYYRMKEVNFTYLATRSFSGRNLIQAFVYKSCRSSPGSILCI